MVYKRLVVDLDGTLCTNTAGGDAYYTALPRQHVIDRVNDYYRAGWHITIYTARGMNVFKGDADRCDSVHRERTAKWLKDNRVFYDELKFGKPAADMYIDDKGIDPDDFAETLPLHWK